MTGRVDTEADLWVDWDQYHGLIEALCVKLHDSGWAFDHVLCLARGGLRVGDVISRLFRLPLAVLSTSSYREGQGSIRGTLSIGASITGTGGPLAGRVLLVDDLVDSGATLAGVVDHLKRQYPDIVEVRSAVLWWKAASSVRPGFLRPIPGERPVDPPAVRSLRWY